MRQFFYPLRLADFAFGLSIAGAMTLGAILVTKAIGMSAEAPRGSAAIFSVTVVCLARLYGWQIGMYGAVLSTLSWDFFYAGPERQLFVDTEPVLFLIYTQWLAIAVLAAPDARWRHGLSRGRLAVPRAPAADALISRIRSEDAPYLLPWHVRDRYGQPLTREDVLFWTQIGRAIGTSDRQPLLSLIDQDSEDLDGDRPVVERDHVGVLRRVRE